MRSWFLGLMGLAVLAGCGPTVGDPCTTALDCGQGTVCVNRDFAPGGYCTKDCSNGQACPAGTICVDDMIGRGVRGCMRSCTTAKDCRAGYSCLPQKNSQSPVCVGPEGI